MDFSNLNFIEILNHLLPGFLAAAVFHNLTAHPKSAATFERVIQALIFSAVLQVATYSVIQVYAYLGQQDPTVASWSSESSLAVSLILALIFGLGLSVCANNNFPHRFFPRWVSTRTFYPSEWFHSLHANPCNLFITLKDGRRIYGWPVEFPDAVDAGHFVLCNAQWISDDNSSAAFVPGHYVLIRATDIEFIELARQDKATEAQKLPCVENDPNGTEEVKTSSNLLSSSDADPCMAHNLANPVNNSQAITQFSMQTKPKNKKRAK